MAEIKMRLEVTDKEKFYVEAVWQDTSLDQAKMLENELMAMFLKINAKS